MMRTMGVTPNNCLSHDSRVKKEIVEMAKSWPIYFSTIFPVSVSNIIYFRSKVIRFYNMYMFKSIKYFSFKVFYQ